MFNIDGLEKTIHQSDFGDLYVYQDLGTFRILTDGYYLYKELPNRKGIDLNPITEGKEGYILTEASPIDQFFIFLKEEVKLLVINFIKTNPTCLLLDVIGYIEAQTDATHADLAKVLLEAYSRAGKAKGLFDFSDTATEDEKFEVLRDFIANTPLEQLQDLFTL